MSQHVNSKDQITEKSSSLQYVARVLGYILLGIGLWVFFVLFLCVVGGGKKLDDPFAIAGFCVSAGWFLLRFADGLFPFSKKFFKTSEEPLS